MFLLTAGPLGVQLDVVPVVSSSSSLQHHAGRLPVFERAAPGRRRRVTLGIRGVLGEHPAVEDERRQGDAARQLLDVPGELQGLELRDPSELHRLRRGDDGDVLGDLERLLQLLGALGAEELVDGLLHLPQVAVDHAQARHVQDDGDGEGHQAHDHKVHPEAAVGGRHAHSHRVVCCAPGAAGGHAGVAPAVLEGDRSDVQGAVVLDLPLPS